MLVNYLQQKGLSKETIKAYNRIILDFITWCDMQNLESENATSTDVMSYLQYLQNKGHQNKTRNINLNAVKHYYNYLVSIEVRTDNPARQIKLKGTKTKKLHNILSKQELEQLYHNYKTEGIEEKSNNKNTNHYTQLSKKRNKAMISLMIYQALTTDEVNRLTIQDVKLKEGKIVIEGTRKSEARELDLKSHQIMELMEYQLTTRQEILKLKGTNTNLYFIQVLATGNEKQNNQTETCIHVWKRLSQEIRIQNPKFKNFQQIRASVITQWLQKYNLREVQYMAGHRYVSTTESYQVNNIEDLVKNIAEYHPIS